MPPQWATTEPARGGGGPNGQNKELLSHQLTKETELKAALIESTERAKGSPPKKAQRLKKGKMLPLCSNLEVAEGGDEVDDE